jgi:DNA-binding PadR family transcriptional regulator
MGATVLARGPLLVALPYRTARRRPLAPAVVHHRFRRPDECLCRLPPNTEYHTAYGTRHVLTVWGFEVSVRHALLALLSEGPKHGFQLRQQFEASTGDVWPLNVGQVYSTLQRLESSGLIESDDERSEGSQKSYRITGPGEAELDHWLSTPPAGTSPPRDELVIKILSALRVPRVDVRDVIQVHRRYLAELMQQWTRLKEDEAEFSLDFAVVADAELFRLESVIRWLDATESRLRRASLEPAVPTGSVVPRIGRRFVVQR